MSSPKILNNKLYLYLTEFFSGMSVMAVELGASRLLAPYFSVRIIFRLSKNGRARAFLCPQYLTGWGGCWGCSYSANPNRRTSCLVRC